MSTRADGSVNGAILVFRDTRHKIISRIRLFYSCFNKLDNRAGFRRVELCMAELDHAYVARPGQVRQKFGIKANFRANQYALIHSVTVRAEPSLLNTPERLHLPSFTKFL